MALSNLLPSLMPLSNLSFGQTPLTRTNMVTPNQATDTSSIDHSTSALQNETIIIRQSSNPKSLPAIHIPSPSSNLNIISQSLETNNNQEMTSQ